MLELARVLCASGLLAQLAATHKRKPGPVSGVSEDLTEASTCSNICTIGLVAQLSGQVHTGAAGGDQGWGPRKQLSWMPGVWPKFPLRGRHFG